MSRIRIHSLVTSLCLAAGLLNPVPLLAKMETWKDSQGNSFKGEPVGMVGQLALFKTGAVTSKKLPVSMLEKAEYARLYEQLRKRSLRAENWAEAKSDVSYDLKGNLKKVEGKKLVDADIRGLREPEFYLVFYVSSGIGKSWEMMGNSMQHFQRLKAEQGDYVQGLLFGHSHTQMDQLNMATSMNVPWYVADYASERSMTSLSCFIPNESFSLLLVSREGIVMNAYSSPEGADIEKAFKEISGFLEAVRPENPRNWAGMLQYWEAVQPVAHANDSCGPLLIGTPVRPEGLKKLGIARVEATLKVGADGQVTEVELRKDAAWSEKVVAALTTALKKNAIFVPAVDKGRFVEGSYTLTIDAPR